MNQQSKKLSFNKSTFLSLKAELLKKQEEVKGKKQLPQHRVENYKPPPVTRIAQADKKETLKDRLKEVNSDELEAQRRTKSALEKKAELYAHLSDGAGASQLAGRFLVDFNTKNKEEKAEEHPRDPSEEPELTNEEYDDDDEWTNFTDCFGRSRRCLKTDYEFYKKRDHEINSILEPAVVPADAPDMSATVDAQVQGSPGAPEIPLLVQKTDAYLQGLRAKWEEKEKELLEKDRDIHYQDLLFDEARAHGVGYYGFSTDEVARRREQAELARARVDTQRAQQQSAARRADRDALVAGRVAAAKARQRVRMGLPPEELVNNDEFQLSSLLDFLTEQKKEAAKKANEEEDRAREKREEERQKLREHYVREWDEGKEGAGGDKKGFREMSQEEYEEQQRSKRMKEFAPLQSSTYNSYGRTENTFDDKGQVIGNNAVSWADVRPNNVPDTQYWESGPSSSKQGLYFSSKNESENNKYSNSAKLTEPVPIVNELEEVDELPRKNLRRNNELGAEIEPPPTYEYYGPESKRSRPQKGPDIRESYEQGLKYLQAMESKKNVHKNLDYTLNN